MPVCYLKLYRRLTGEKDGAVGKHFKEIGIWLALMVPIGFILYQILDTAFIYELADYTSVEDLYNAYLIICTLSIVFVTPIFKLCRKIAVKAKEADMYGY